MHLGGAERQRRKKEIDSSVREFPDLLIGDSLTYVNLQSRRVRVQLGDNLRKQIRT